jgi:5-methylcytosine-specific restriction endonuclease McrA
MTEERECKLHGLTIWVLRPRNRWQCRKCSSEAVTKARKSHRLLLVQEAGGKCERCGYDRYYGALEFHHRDPSTKLFEISGKGQTFSLARKRAEAAKCALLCSNCHREVEAGIILL